MMMVCADAVTDMKTAAAANNAEKPLVIFMTATSVHTLNPIVVRACVVHWARTGFLIINYLIRLTSPTVPFRE
jgi:hypothetical protein